MATVGDELYWQLIENFVYSLVRFQLSQCALVICVSDAHCMQLCGRYNFPCFDYQHHIDPKPSVMEQIANVKLFVIPQAMKLGVNIFMLDLDVGFLENPMIMIHAFNESPIMDIFVQEDLIFIMNRTKAGWKKVKKYYICMYEFCKLAKLSQIYYVNCFAMFLFCRTVYEFMYF